MCIPWYTSRSFSFVPYFFEWPVILRLAFARSYHSAQCWWLVKIQTAEFSVDEVRFRNVFRLRSYSQWRMLAGTSARKIYVRVTFVTQTLPVHANIKCIAIEITQDWRDTRFQWTFPGWVACACAAASTAPCCFAGHNATTPGVAGLQIIPQPSPNEGANAGLRDRLPAPILEPKCHHFRFRRSPLEALLGPGKVIFGASCVSSECRMPVQLTVRSC